MKQQFTKSQKITLTSAIGRALAQLLIVAAIPTSQTAAKEVPVQARLYFGATSVEPDDLNTELAAQGLKDVDTIVQYGAEMLYPLAKYLDVGLRYGKHNILVEEISNPSVTEYDAEIDQNMAMAMVRISFLKTNIVRFDGFAGYGGSNTTFKITSATQDGELNKKDSGSWFATPYSAFGASVSLGYKKFYFVIEGGVENNKVDGFKRTGNINNNVETIDLSGSYMTIGFMFDGVGATRK